MTKVHRIAGLRVSRLSGREVLPDLAPPEERLQRERSHIFSSDSITLSHSSAVDDVFDPCLREEHRDMTARLTVYVMNLIVIALSAPVGLAVLVLNILGGENLRTTAHAIALTGMFMALAQIDGALPTIAL